ncbi:hypothetical protein [Sinomonas sp. ASV322]|uniref:hypothetical protein n=1 Tax=Sinomonas sp. ASV322 TaxID=3041920 RepID=UPI0027DBE937|nr:hypothetical protein [Sinomonas sp. ASV322]MDQ4502352.1 hypothetical protein [Sinomonas sp. ASV322]
MNHKDDPELREVDGTAGDWLAQRLHTSDTAIGRVVPSDYFAYARVFPPVVDGRGRRHRWSAYAAEAGFDVSAGTPWDAIARRGDPEFGEPPMGSLDFLTASALAGAVSLHTSTADSCFFAFWVGYAGIPVPTMTTAVFPPSRRMSIFRGSVFSASNSIGMPPGNRRAVRWWPEDHAWCVGADIYSRSVLVGGSAKCIDTILSNAEVEAYRVNDELRSELHAL